MAVVGEIGASESSGGVVDAEEGTWGCLIGVVSGLEARVVVESVNDEMDSILSF
jgi:hypothetical protein